MEKNKVIKLVSLGLSVVGAAVSVVAGIVEDKKLDSKITEEVAKVIAKQNGES